MSTAGTPSRRYTSALLVRLLIPGLVVMVLTESHAARTVNPINVVFALDISDSNPDVDRGVAYISDSVRTQKRGSRGDVQTLVVFGKAPAVEISPLVSFPLESIESKVDRGATNLEQALTVSLAMISEGKEGRIVLISDGNQTNGDVSRTLPELKSRHIAVDVLPIEYSYEREVWLEGLELPQQVSLGETYDATVLLSATVDGKGMLTLNEGGGRIARQSIDYKAGQNRFTVPFTVETVGYHEYIANLDVARDMDSRVQNNTVLNSLYVDGDRRVLLVKDSTGPRDSWAPFADAVSKTSGTLEVITRHALPDNAQQLASYDVIVFANVPRREFDQKQLEAVRDVVDQEGVGFLMLGGVNSFGPGGYQKTPIEEILPVSCDPPDGPESKAAMVVILDVIPSSDGEVRAKAMLSNLIKSLGTADELGVMIRQKGDDVWLFPLTPVAKSSDLQPVIAAAQFDRVHNFEPTLKAALRELLTRKINTRHVLIISDGSPRGPSTELLLQYQKAGITISAAVIYPPGGSDHSSLSRITATTQGQYHFVNHPNKLVSVVSSEVNLLNRRALRQQVFDPTVGNGSTIFKDLRGVPPLLGYVATSLKSNAVAPELVVPSTAQSSESPVPLLAFGHHGLGRTAAFTSNFDANWGELWQTSPQFPQFVDRLLKRLDRPKNLRISTRLSGEIATVIVHDLQADDLPLPLKTNVYGPDEEAEPLLLSRVGPQRYEAKVPLGRHGRYHIVTTLSARDRHESAFGAFGHIATYSPEFLQLSSNKQSLEEIATATGGRKLTGDPAKDAVYARGRTLKYVSQSSFDWMLILLALLVPTYAACQRLWHDAKLAREQWDLPPDPSPTLLALFKTKEWVSSALSSKGTARMLIQIWAPPPVRHVSTAATVGPATPQGTTSSTDSSSTTIEKLLAMKRQQNEHS